MYSTETNVNVCLPSFFICFHCSIYPYIIMLSFFGFAWRLYLSESLHCYFFLFVFCLSSFVLVKELDSPILISLLGLISTYFPSSFRFSLYACYYTSTVTSITTIGPISTVKLITSLYDDLATTVTTTYYVCTTSVYNTNRYPGCASPTR